MRILTWNVNVLRTCLDYHPFSSMKKRNVEGLLDTLEADILCFQEHKTRRPQLERSMACPGPYDGFWTFPRSKTGYSGVCTYVDSRVCVPMKAEEGITGLLLGDVKGSTMKPPWTEAERIGCYPDIEELNWTDEIDGASFDPKRLDMEGRSVVLDFGMFVLFNLYCPNETNESRRPYKMNHLLALQTRVKLLMAAGREVIIVGDINIMRAPIDSGEGGIRTSAEQHYEHPARRILDDWCAPKGPMIDVVRESWPDRDDMFTCWNTKLDARPSNYGSRIDMILCSPGLRPWIKGGDIEPKVFGSDHCPVHLDLHDEITTPDGTVLKIRDMMNPSHRAVSTAPAYPNDIPRDAPEPPRFATKFLDEFSGKQTNLKSFFGAGKAPPPKRKESQTFATPTPPRELGDTPVSEKEEEHLSIKTPGPPRAPSPEGALSTPISLARAAFDTIDTSPSASTSKAPVAPPTRRQISIDLTEDEPIPSHSMKTPPTKRAETSKSKTKTTTKTSASQTTLSSFFAQPPSRAKRKSTTPPVTSQPTSSKRSSLPQSSPIMEQSDRAQSAEVTSQPTEEEAALIAHAIEEADAARERKKAENAPVWGSLFARKLPPLCTVHQKPCKDFIVKIPGPNKGKRFWLCSLPVGAGYDNGRTKRPREDVNPNFRFLWDSANSRKEEVVPGGDRGNRK